MKNSAGKRKKAINLYKLDKYTISEIAAIVNSNVNTVKFWINKYKHNSSGLWPSNKILNRRIKNRQAGFSSWIDNICRQ